MSAVQHFTHNIRLKPNIQCSGPKVLNLKDFIFNPMVAPHADDVITMTQQERGKLTFWMNALTLGFVWKSI